MGNSETFGVEKGHGEKIITWLNKQAKLQNNKLEARLYNYEVSTKNFGHFRPNSGCFRSADNHINKYVMEREREKENNIETKTKQFQ